MAELGEKKNYMGIENKAVLTILCFLLAILFILPPLFYLSLKPNGLAPGFLPLRMINADLKFLIVTGCMSLVVGIMFVKIHLQGEMKKLSKKILFFGGLFLMAVMVSTAISHNPMRAWVSSLQWHIVPLLFALCLFQIRWNRKCIISVLGLLLAGGVVSCLVTMDQHYQWTDWSHRLVRNGYAGIIFNQNFAAEYHAPLIPLALGLCIYLRSWWGRSICLFLILAIFLPAVSLSMARGAWVGHIGGTLGVIVLFFLVLKISSSKKETKGVNKPQRKVMLSLLGFIILGVLLPGYLITSDFWKKGGHGWKKLNAPEITENYQVVAGQKSISPSPPNQSAQPLITETRESQELKSVVDLDKSASIKRRLVLWEDAFKECLSGDFLVGKGTDHYELFYHESAKLSDQNWGKTLVRFVHNDFIQIFYENGILGLVGWIGIWGIIIWKGLFGCVGFFRSGNSEELGLRLGLIACILCFLIEALFEFPTRSPCAMFVGWSALGILAGLNYNHSIAHGEIEQFDLRKKPFSNLTLGVIGVVLPIYACFLTKDLFWANVYHFQGRAAVDANKPQLSLHFHKESIAHAPWRHLSRKAEGYLLITREKRYLDAMKSIEETLKVHPGCLQAHQNRIALLINEFKNLKAAKLAFLDMKKAAPFHPFTLAEERKLKKIFQVK